MSVHAHIARLEEIEAAVADERALWRLVDAVAVDAALDGSERAHLLGRARFYLDDSHGCRRAAEHPAHLIEPVA